MTAIDQLSIIKFAVDAASIAAEGSKIPGILTGAGTMAALVPASTYTRVHDKEGWRGAGAGAATDIGRGVGGLLGMTTSKGLERGNIPMPQSNAARAALMLAAITGGATAGHYRGKQIGQEIFHPGTRMERLHRAVSAY